MDQNVEHIKTLLRNKNLKATSSRIKLLTQMYNYESAIPYSSIQKIMSAHDRVTIYRTLETLTEQGVIHKAYQDDQDIYYAICGVSCNHKKHDHNHIHFKCILCEEVTCKPLNTLEPVELENHQILDVSIFIKGICPVCVQS